MSRPAHNSTPTGFRRETRNIILARVVTVICLDCAAMSFYKKDRLSKYSDLLCKNRKSYKNNFPSCSLYLPLFHSRFTNVCVYVCVCYVSPFQWHQQNSYKKQVSSQQKFLTEPKIFVLLSPLLSKILYTLGQIC